MEFSVTILGLKGGGDLKLTVVLRLARHRNEVKSMDSWSQSFTCNDMAAWAVTRPYGDRSEATKAFNKLFGHAQCGKLTLKIRCSYDLCGEERCHGVHRISAVDFAQLDQDQLDSIPGIGRGRRYRILVEYWMYRKRELGEAAA